MIIDGYTAELLINRAIGGTTLEESVKALQDVFVDHDPAEKGEPMSDLIDRQAAIDVLDVLCQEHRYKMPGKRETYSQYNEAWQDALDRAET